MGIMVAGAIAVFAAGANICMFALIWSGRMTCIIPADPVIHSMGALPHVWCPQHGQVPADGKSLVHKTLSQHSPGLVIDVGAFDGKEAIEYALAGHKVMSFEPTPSKGVRIRQAIRDAGVEESVNFYPWAVSDHSGEAPFIVNVAVHLEEGHWAVDDDKVKDPTKMGSEQDGFNVPWNKENSTTVNVKVEKLDNVVPPGQYVLFMKVDSQGHDFSVLRGADQLLTEQRILVFSAEISPGLMVGGQQEALDMLNYIASKGYNCHACQTSFETGFRFGLPIPHEVWAEHVASLKFEHRGANHGQWDDIVCYAKTSSFVFKPAPAEE
eukprot:CAMPEP_0181288470 /NCGR_PEP_ID=MMETSP1101-20121128/348_1 /TAXON_ID=46948 /ORGANISM="Rhodomonas abbreviata, Strain Caron Lab Isolate" /LENGTH=323 /DNA_ID=CAMNT_0023392591 /DNA_START=138 /DNA_END=1109 /DNA_ORIENTATION=+